MEVMDYAFEKAWQETLKRVSTDFGEDLDLSSILLLIGFQESNQEKRAFSKDGKINLMHVAICTLLEPYGFYKFTGQDDDRWPHFERVETMPDLSPEEQDRLIRKAIMEFFNN